MGNQSRERRLEHLVALGREAYGDGFEAFLQTPRRSLGMECPASLIERGDYEPVIALLVKAIEGDFS